jgi:Fe-S-cluster containining protein
MNEHDFKRTTCACKQCVDCCKRQPGCLIEGDFERIADHLGETKEQAKEHFWASPGALVKTEGGQVVRVGTITPRYRKGRCVFLDENDRCKIHSVAPFGCAFLDTHMSREYAMPRSLAAVRSQCSDQYQKLRDELPYATHYKPTKY